MGVTIMRANLENLNAYELAAMSMILSGKEQPLSSEESLIFSVGLRKHKDEGRNFSNFEDMVDKVLVNLDDHAAELIAR